MSGSWETVWQGLVPLGEQLEAINQYLLERPLALVCSAVLVFLSGLLWRCLRSRKKREYLDNCAHLTHCWLV